MFLIWGLAHTTLSPYWATLSSHQSIPHATCFSSPPCVGLGHSLEMMDKKARSGKMSQLPSWQSSCLPVLQGLIINGDQPAALPRVQMYLFLFPPDSNSYKTSRNSTPLSSLSTCQIWPATSEVIKTH